MTENEYQQAFLRRAIEMIRDIQKSIDMETSKPTLKANLAVLEGYLTGGLEIFEQLSKLTKEV
jgi:hypothetical protein